MLFDSVSLSFCLIIILIFTSVIIFRHFYIEHEPNKKRFILLVILFVISILCLIFIPNLITLLLGWDGLGITSFCLVIYYQNYKSLIAGIITAIINRIGDAAIILTITWISVNRQWTFIYDFFKTNAFIVALLILAAITKRAQLPFSTWLPAAIAAPTPVSALVHSSTLVTGGVFLLIRFFPFISSFRAVPIILLIAGSLTTIISGRAAIKENDLKKIIALSTLRQLGTIFTTLSLSIPILALLHLYTHAIFKALLFILAGILIHINAGNQDIRTFGTIKVNTLIAVAFNIRILAICCVPFLAGFYSKENIISFILESPPHIVGLILILISAALTIKYSIRVTMKTLYSKKTTYVSPLTVSSELPRILFIPILLLLVIVICGGRIFVWIILPWSTLPVCKEKFLIIPIAIIIIIIVKSSYKFLFTIAQKKSPIKLKKYPLTNVIILIDQVPRHSTVKGFFYIRSLLNKTTDKGWSEFIGPQQIFNTSQFIRSIIKKTIFTFITVGFTTLILTSLFLIII